MELERLREKLRQLARRELMHGSAMLVGGRKKSRRKSTRGAAMLAGKKKSIRRSSYGCALLAEGRKSRRKSTRGAAMLAGKRKKRHGNKNGTNALKEINHIARQLKAKNPRLEHTEAISQASRIYRNQ